MAYKTAEEEFDALMATPARSGSSAEAEFDALMAPAPSPADQSSPDPSADKFQLSPEDVEHYRAMGGHDKFQLSPEDVERYRVMGGQAEPEQTQVPAGAISVLTGGPEDVRNFNIAGNPAENAVGVGERSNLAVGEAARKGSSVLRQLITPFAQTGSPLAQKMLDVFANADEEIRQLQKEQEGRPVTPFAKLSETAIGLAPYLTGGGTAAAIAMDAADATNQGATSTQALRRGAATGIMMGAAGGVGRLIPGSVVKAITTPVQLEAGNVVANTLLGEDGTAMDRIKASLASAPGNMARMGPVLAALGLVRHGSAKIAERLGPIESSAAEVLPVDPAAGEQAPENAPGGPPRDAEAKPVSAPSGEADRAVALATPAAERPTFEVWSAQMLDDASARGFNVLSVKQSAMKAEYERRFGPIESSAAEVLPVDPAAGEQPMSGTGTEPTPATNGNGQYDPAAGEQPMGGTAPEAVTAAEGGNGQSDPFTGEQPMGATVPEAATAVEGGNGNGDGNGTAAPQAPEGGQPLGPYRAANARVNAGRSMLQQEQITSPQRKSNVELQAQVQREGGAEQAMDIAAEVSQSKRIMKDWEVISMMDRAGQLESEMFQLVRKIGNGTATPEEVEEFRRLGNMKDFLETTSRVYGGTEASRTLHARKLSMDESTDKLVVVGIARDRRARRGEKLTPEAQEKLEDMTDQVLILQGELDDAHVKMDYLMFERAGKRAKEVKRLNSVEREAAENLVLELLGAGCGQNPIA